jgi:hypothetical protein
MEDLITAVNQAIDELEGYYDGAPDSRTLWLGSIIVDLREAVAKAERTSRLVEAREIIDELIGCNPDSGVRPSVQRAREFLKRTETP